MIKATKEEQNLLDVASKLRSLVLADFEKQAAPASRALLNQLSPSVSRLVKTLPDKTVVALALPISSVLDGKKPSLVKESMIRTLEAGGSKSGAVTMLKCASTLKEKKPEALAYALDAVREFRLAFNTLKEFI